MRAVVIMISRHLLRSHGDNKLKLDITMVTAQPRGTAAVLPVRGLQLCIARRWRTQGLSLWERLIKEIGAEKLHEPNRTVHVSLHEVRSCRLHKFFCFREGYLFFLKCVTKKCFCCLWIIWTYSASTDFRPASGSHLTRSVNDAGQQEPQISAVRDHKTAEFYSNLSAVFFQ